MISNIAGDNLYKHSFCSFFILLIYSLHYTIIVRIPKLTIHFLLSKYFLNCNLLFLDILVKYTGCWKDTANTFCVRFQNIKKNVQINMCTSCKKQELSKSYSCSFIRECWDFFISNDSNSFNIGPFRSLCKILKLLKLQLFVIMHVLLDLIINYYPYNILIFFNYI